MDKAMESFKAAGWAFAALLCFNCSGGLKAFRPIAQGDWFVVLVLARFGLILTGFALIVVSAVKLVQACR
jgi:hypothetical protein